MIERTNAYGDVPIMNLKPLDELENDLASTIWRYAIGTIVVFVASIVILAAIGLSMVTAWPRDLDGKYATQDPALHAWFDKLRSAHGLCCSFIDGRRVEDPDWTVEKGHYRVRIDGNWIDVPDDAVIQEPNRAGFVVVWPMTDSGGRISVRCFLRGTES
jgi:hypothetical protein